MTRVAKAMLPVELEVCRQKFQNTVTGEAPEQQALTSDGRDTHTLLGERLPPSAGNCFIKPIPIHRAPWPGPLGGATTQSAFFPRYTGSV